MVNYRSSLKRYRPVIALTVTYVFTVAFVNPVREAAFWDDWVYALMVRSLLTAGSYSMHPFINANPVFQIYWGALFSRLLGFSFATLRISTLLLFFVGIVSMYGFSRETGLGRRPSFLLALMFAASPVILWFSFTFNTDVPFLSWLTVTLFLYSHALRQKNAWWMLAASISATAAILVRQHGIVILAALGMLGIVDKDRKQHILLYISGVLLPILASAAQIYIASAQPTWATSVAVRLQQDYLAHTGQFLANLAWRPIVAVEYLAIYCWPLSALLVVYLGKEIIVLRSVPANDSRVRLNLTLMVVFAIFMIVASLAGVLVLQKNIVLPAIASPLDFVAAWPPVLRIALTVFALAAVYAFGRIMVLRFSAIRRSWANMALADGITLLFGLIVLGYFNLDPRYFFPLTPCFLIIAGQHLNGWLQQNYKVAATVTIIALVASAMWVRAQLVGRELEWGVSEQLHASGISTEQIYGSWEWNSYYGEFDRYLAGGGVNDFDPAKSYFLEWLPARLNKSTYLVALLPEALGAPDWVLVRQIPDQKIPLIDSQVYVYRHVK